MSTSTLQQFLDEQNRALDIAKVVSPDLEQMEAALPPRSVYKYLSSSREEFFSVPTIRFTQKTALNDPFELTQRWDEFASAEVRETFADHIRSVTVELTKNKGLVLQIIKEELAKKGLFLSPDQMAEAARTLLTSQGSHIYQSIVENAISQVSPFTEIAFDMISTGARKTFDQVALATGIFSLSETPTNEQLWGLYAEGGRGFVVEFNAYSNFFLGPSGRNLLRKVRYTNDRISDFWKNPLYLFLVKNENWAFEREWRMLKPLTECDLALSRGSDKIHLSRVKPGMITSVTFGYNYDRQKLAEHAVQLRSVLDPDIHIQLAVPNQASGAIELERLL